MELEFLSSIADFVQTPVSVIAVGVTAWAAWAATRTAKAAEHSVKETRKTSQDQLRAYVLIEGAELSYELNGVKTCSLLSGHTLWPLFGVKTPDKHLPKMSL